MQGMKIYILIEDQENHTEVRIDGDLESLCELLYALRAKITNTAIALPAQVEKL